ncbi:MAG: DJ-1/PfpI family protein [Candidatus Woesearchaeota archaeon]
MNVGFNEKIKLLAIFFAFVFISGCSHTDAGKEFLENNKTSSKVQNKSILMIIAPKDFRDEELKIPKTNFERSGIRVFVASSEETSYGMLGSRINRDFSLEEALNRINEFDAVILVGGSGSAVYFNNSLVKEIVLKAYESNKLIGAICLAPVILANAGILENRSATVFDHEYIKIIEEKGAAYSSEDVVVDGNIVTANSPNSALKFSDEIIKKLK